MRNPNFNIHYCKPNKKINKSFPQRPYPTLFPAQMEPNLHFSCQFWTINNNLTMPKLRARLVERISENRNEAENINSENRNQ